MPIRDFVDKDGALWVVWPTTPSVMSRHGVDTAYRDGWLTFTSGSARRRLSPIPADWQDAPPQRLGTYLRLAVNVRQTPPHGGEVFDDRSP
jgi:hypothetical protein